MSARIRVHQVRAMAEARVLKAMADAPPQIRKAQAARVFEELKAMTKGGADGGEQQARQWWLRK